MAILPISSWRKSVYIAPLKSTSVSGGNQTQVYDTPISVILNVQPLSERASIEIFGVNVKKIYKAMYVGTNSGIKEFDLAYLDGATPTGETRTGFNANYVVRRVGISNVMTTIYFESIKGK